MSTKYPVIAITGSSGAGTTTVTHTFQHIFRREGLNAAIVEGDSFHRYDRKEMKARMAEATAEGNAHFSHFGPEANLFEELEELFRAYGETGRGRMRKYLHNEEEAAAVQPAAGHVHAVGRHRRRHRSAVLRGAARRGGRPRPSTSHGMSTC